MKEVWKPIPSFPRYEVSNIGRIRSIRTKQLTKLIKNNHGYMRFKATITETTRKYKKFFLVHRCVAEAFLGPAPSPKHEVNHMNKKRDDNRVTNLEWVTKSQNGIHRARFKFYKEYARPKKNAAKLSRTDVMDIKLSLVKGLTVRQLAKKFRVTSSTIYKIKHGHSWSNVLI